MIDSENVKWYLILFLLLTGISPLLHSDNPTRLTSDPVSPYNNELGITSDIQNYTTHDPIVVIGDDNFTLNGFSGNGTWKSPYMLESLNITVEFDSEVAIRISNVTKHFIISNCFFSTLADSYPGLIVIENASNWKIEHTIVSGSGIGIGLYYDSCRYVSVVDSCFTGLWAGVWFVDSRNVSICNNEFIDSYRYGIMCELITGCEILNNTFSKNDGGVLAAYMSQTLVMDNLFVGGVSGIVFHQNREGLLIKS
ncbi:MAG: NosD domain-containing protein, partial [Candidatus Thorarchaeota archaeon]